MHSLISKIDPEKFEPHLAYFFGDNVHSEFHKLKVPIFKLNKNKRFDLSVMKQINSIISEHEIDIVHAQHFMPMIYAFYGCKIRHKIGLVCTFHSEWEVEDIPIRWRIIGSRIMNKIDCAVAVSRRVAESIVKKFKLDCEKVCTIHNGVDLDIYSGINRKKNIRKSLLIEDYEIVLGTIGNLKKVKNQMMLLRSFELILTEEPNVRLIIVGQGFIGDKDNTETELREYIVAKGLEKKVFLLGYQENVHNILKEIDIFCLTSKMEGLPISLIEAMAAGVPVIGTSVQGIRDVIKNYDNGMVVKDDDIQGLKDAIVLLIRNSQLRSKIAQSARENVIINYSLKECVNKYERLYLEIK